MPLPELVTSEASVAAIARACEEAGAIALDLEFVSQDRYRPDLALVQVAWKSGADVEVRLVDPLSVDVAPVIALCGGAVAVIVHAPRQDLQILASRFGLRARRVFDTQTAAAFAQLGDQVGYARAVEAVIGEKLGKESQWTDWLRRPLVEDQLRYADADVRYLPALAETLAGKLDALGRHEWALEESDAIAEVAYRAAMLAPDDAWREVGGVRHLDLDGRAAARRLAAWRLRAAEAQNKPVSWIIGDKAIVEIARVRPRDEKALRAVKLPESARRYAAELIAAVAMAEQDPREGLELGTALGLSGSGGTRAAVWEEIIIALVQASSEETGIPARYLGTRGDVEDLARALEARIAPASGGLVDLAWEEVAHPMLRGWRREVIGSKVLAWLRGDAALYADPSATSGVRLR
ncbi:MAG TPA: HRDC domain-containing protein [Kofleriaceae bacterium]|nr:HRDC domain-containing protein [Kofleriaceae bacterium]